MNLIRYIIIVLFLVPISAFAQKHQHSKEEIEKLLVQLDSAIANKQVYQEKRQVRADSLRKLIYKCNPNQYVERCQELFSSLNDYDGKRSLEALRLIELADTYKTDIDLQAWVSIKKAEVYGTMGLYHKAKQLLSSVSPQKVSDERRLQYYHAFRSFYQRVSDYVSDYDIAEEEEGMIVAYYDSILALSPASVGRDISIANKDLYMGNYEQGLQTALRDLPIAKGKEYVYLCSTLAHLYGGLGDQDDYLYYLLLTSIEDIKNGTTEYEALPYVVQALYEKGDISRAYVYLLCVMEDANLFPTRNLAVKISNYFPLVSIAYDRNAAYTANADKSKRNALALTFALLSLTLCVVFYMGWKYNNTKEQKQRADELQALLDKAAVADRIKTVFIQNIRHEIRTPLNAIVGFAQLMSNDLTTEERELYSGYIQESNNQLLNILDTIIDVSNMEVGSFNFHFEEIDIDDLCNERMKDCDQFLPQNVKLTYVPEAKGLHLYCDRKRIAQVLDNLLSNACKYTTEGSIQINVIHSVDNKDIQFIITDTGVGIPIDKKDLIFERFEKIDAYSPGLGLGLYISNLIARALGGDVHFDENYNGGARFIFTVPIRNANHPIDTNIQQ